MRIYVLTISRTGRVLADPASLHQLPHTTCSTSDDIQEALAAYLLETFQCPPRESHEVRYPDIRALLGKNSTLWYVPCPLDAPIVAYLQPLWEIDCEPDRSLLRILFGDSASRALVRVLWTDDPVFNQGLMTGLRYQSPSNTPTEGRSEAFQTGLEAGVRAFKLLYPDH